MSEPRAHTAPGSEAALRELSQARRAGAGLRLALGAHGRGRAGEGRLIDRPGASMEFYDHRPYNLGDDLRHLDWRVAARRDQLMLRRHRQEAEPRVDIVLDISASMAITPAKTVLARCLAVIMAAKAAEAGARATLWLLGSGVMPVKVGRSDDWTQALYSSPFEGAGGLMADPRPAFAPGGDRVVISDGLAPEGARTAVRRLGAQAASLTLIEVLSHAERHPTPRGAVALVGAEGGARHLTLDRPACEAYERRLARHRDGWRTALRGRGHGVIACGVDSGLNAAVGQLVRAQLLVPGR